MTGQWYAVKDGPSKDRVLKEVKEVLGTETGAESKLLAVCSLLKRMVRHYDWVGFYLTDPAKVDELVLGPYVGAPTEHVRIPFGRGICGQAAEMGRLFLVPDVMKEGNYLSCSPSVRSEIVVPVLRSGMVLGELDIDSHTADAFDGWDRELLEAVSVLVEPVMG